MNQYKGLSQRYIRLVQRFRKEALENRTDAEVWANELIDRIFSKTDYQVEYIYRTKRFDFYFPLLRIALEIDGGYHKTDEQKKKDFLRDMELLKQNIKVIRCDNFDNENLIKLLDYIKLELNRVNLIRDIKKNKKQKKKNKKLYGLNKNTPKWKKKKIKKLISDSLKTSSQKPKIILRQKADCRIHDSLKFKSTEDRKKFMQEQLERALKKNWNNF